MKSSPVTITSENQRLIDAKLGKAPWKKWGPYLSERQWGTVREDYSENGDAWNYFTHDQSRARAYRWGEDGIAGISDDKQFLCFSLALWNGKDDILKERLFGLTNSQGNHGEDVKEYYFYLDSTPTHSYMKYLYKYPHAKFPYHDLIKQNGSRTKHEFEYELIDTAVFDNDNYFDVFIEYAKNDPEDILIKISVHNRSAQKSTLHLLPTLLFRNTWSWGNDMGSKPSLSQLNPSTIQANHPILGSRNLYCYKADNLLFTENETDKRALFGQENNSPFVKDGFHKYLVNGKKEAVNPNNCGTKSAALYNLTINGGESSEVWLRLTSNDIEKPFESFQEIFSKRVQEADAFYQSITPPKSTPDESLVFRQALAGMLWNKQYFNFDVYKWLCEKGRDPFTDKCDIQHRNQDWFHMANADIISMPDKWEYPWYAAWDLAFHTIALAKVDIDFAKDQLLLMVSNNYFHPNGQIPAYEWNFSDVNPPVHAWATVYLFKQERSNGVADYAFLEKSFFNLALNFNWWLNRKDPEGRNVFSGGFLGLDNIGVFDRSAQLPTGGSLEQADGTAWMAFYCQAMIEMALVLAEKQPHFEDVAFKYIQHFIWISYAMNRVGDHEDEMWDEEDGFFYDLLRKPKGEAFRLKVRSMVGLLPLCASTVFEFDIENKFPRLHQQLQDYIQRYPTLVNQVSPTERGFKGYKGRRLLSTLNEENLKRVLAYMLNEDEFLSPHGIRSLSKYHDKNPFHFHVGDQKFEVKYMPAESDSDMFGGNSNWRGPVWMPVNGLIIRSLLNLYRFYGNEFTVECPVGSGNFLNLYEVAKLLSERLATLFVRSDGDKRAVYGDTEKFQNDPHWRDLILFYEYFHGDNGAGIGASHQCGWTGIVAELISLFGTTNADEFLNG